jgi:membrane complex biogenesis BtpA family protein
VVVGMLHAPALPGSPNYGGNWAAVRDAVLLDAAALIEGGVHGLMLENFGDAPFFKGRVPPEVVGSLTALALAVKRETDLPLGINVLRNDGESALAVALASAAQYVRVNVLSGAVVTDQGLIEADAARLMRRRREMSAEHVDVLADVRVKHAAPLGPGWRPIEQEVDELIHRTGADAVIISGTGTGKPTSLKVLARAKAAAGDTPVFVGSGATPGKLTQLALHADGLIVGTFFKQDGVLGRPVDVRRVRELMQVLERQANHSA